MPSRGNLTCQDYRSKLAFLLLLLLQIPTPGSPTVDKGATRSGKQQQHAWWSLQDAAHPGEFSPLENVTRNNEKEAATVSPGETDAATGRLSSPPARPAEELTEPVRPSQVDAAKAAIIKEFVGTHGEAIRRSRRHADLFDNSGYLIDLMDDLKEFQSRASDQASEQKSRKRRSATEENSDDNAGEEESLPDFDSLSEALDFLNGGKQAEILNEAFKLRFHSEEEGGDRSRRKRSAGEGERSERDEDGDQEKEAEESVARLDANLLELARYLEEEAEEQKAAAEDASSDSAKQRQAIANFHSRLGKAYGNLVQLRNVASDLVSAANGPASQRERMRHLLYPAKAANWHIEAGALRDNVRELEKLYKQMDEL